MKSDANQLLSSGFVRPYSRRQENDKQGKTMTQREELNAAKAQAVPQWIPVSERMPENEGTYFCLGHNGTPFVCLFRTTKYEGKIWLRSTGTKRVYGITHWMPVPTAPEQNK